MTRMPLRHIVISGFLLALTGCATNLGGRVDALEERVRELEQNSQTQRVVLDARFDAINHELAGSGTRLETGLAKGKQPSGSKEPPQNKVPAAAPRYIDPAPSLAKVSGAAPGNSLGASSGNSTGNAVEPGPAKPHDPVREALAAPVDSKEQPQNNASQPDKSGKSGGAESAYKSALNLLESGKATAAKQAFEKFLAEYPGSGLEPNAYYWLGESSYTLKQYDQAILTFKDVPNKYPKHPKAAAAMLKTAFSYLRLGDKDNARFYLQALLEQYPNSEPAGLAKKQLSSL